MGRELTVTDLDHIKQLLFMGLDFVSKDLNQYLEDYIHINRKTFTEIGSITTDLFDAWIDEWYDQK